MFQRLALILASAALALPGALCAAQDTPRGGDDPYQKYLDRPIPPKWVSPDTISEKLFTTAGPLTLKGDTLVPPVWSYAPERLQEIPSGSDSWWRSFSDPTLDSLVSLGVERNFNLAMALRRINVARDQMRQAQAGWYPAVALDAGWTQSRSSGALGRGPSYGPGAPDAYFDAGLTAQWEIDVFGKIASGVKAKKASYRASRAEYAGTMVSLTAQIASTYMSLRMMQMEYDVAVRHARNQMEIVRLARARFEASLASKLDVAQALETYYSTMASVPALENSIHQSMNALAVLIGEYPENVRQWLSAARPLPECAQRIQAGVPMDLLRRRPDIAQAEQELAAYAAAVGVAKKDFLPTLTLEGQIGTSSRRLGDLFSGNSLSYSIAPRLSWTLFSGLSRRYAVAQAKENLQMGIDNYNQVVLTAVQEADNAICAYYHSLKRMEFVELTIEQNDEALRLAIARYKASMTPMNDVVTALLNALSAENQLIQARGAALTALINLYKALGGSY